MRLIWSEDSWADYLFWQETNQVVLQKLNDLIRDAKRSPFSGLGKPEPLKKGLQGWWSRRITGEHRLVYRVSGSGVDQCMEVASCRFHYEKT